MNYLAHLFLAENHAASRVGNLLGDFVTGRPESLRGRFPEAVLQGIVRHRVIDRFADSHRATDRLKTCVAPARRRFAGVIIDIVHDQAVERILTAAVSRIHRCLQHRAARSTGNPTRGTGQ